MGQQRIQNGLATSEVILPPGTTLDQSELMFHALAGLNIPVRQMRDSFGRRTIVLEKLGLHGSTHYLLSYPPDFEGIIKSHIAAMVPGVMFNEFDAMPRKWDFALTLHPSWTEEERPREKLIPALNKSLEALQKDEAALLQFVVSPHGRSDMSGEFMACARVAARGVRTRPKSILRHIKTAYGSLGVSTRRIRPDHRYRITKRTAPPHSWPLYLTSRELAILAGMADGAAGRTQLPPSPMVPREGIVLGTSNYPGITRPIAVSVESLKRHCWIVGPTGSGKSVLLHHIANQIIAAGHGLLLVEPKGTEEDLAWNVLRSIETRRMHDVIWFDPTETERPCGLNCLAGDPEQVTGHVVSLFKNLYGDSWGPRLEDILYGAVMTAAQARLTLYDVKQLLVNPEFRARTLRTIHDTELQTFWQRLEDGPEGALDSVINKVNAFLRRRAMRRIVGQTAGLNLSEVVNRNKIVLVPLPTGPLDDEAVSMLGSLLVAQLWQAIRTRTSKAPFFLIADELQQFVGKAGDSLEDILTMGRSYGLGVIGANQDTAQKDIKPLLHTLKTNARSKIVFQVEPDDAKTMAPAFPPLGAAELQALGEYEVAARLRTDKGMAPVTTLITNKPPEPTGHAPAIIAASRALYGVDVADIESAWTIRHIKPETGRKRRSYGWEE